MPTREKQSELDRLGHQLATVSAGAIIETCCPQPDLRKDWFNIKHPSRGDKGDVARAVKYLELRGLLKRHPSNADLVRCRRG
jgi:hypothetical protein